MTRSILTVAALAASLAALPTAALATSFTCKCDTNFAPAVNSGNLNKDGNNFTCQDTWTDNSTGHDTGGYNGNVKFSFPDAVVKGSNTNVKFAARTGQSTAPANVRGFVRKWRARQDSNLLPQD